MNNLDQQKPGEKSARRRDKKKRNRKVEQQASPAQEQAEAASEAVHAAMAEPVSPLSDAVLQDRTPAEPVEDAEPVARTEAAPSRPVERVASFRERMASVTPPAESAPRPAPSADTSQPAPPPAPAATPVAGIEAIAKVYRDYAKKSLQDAQTFAEKLSAARSLDKAVEAQTEFARQACETFADNSRKIRELHRELFWQAFRLPNWPLGRTRGG